MTDSSLYSGRIGRLVFARNIAILAVAILIVTAVVPILQHSDSDLAGSVLVILLIATVYGGAVYSLHNVVRRLHDLDFSGWLALTFYIPPIGILVLIALLLVPGTPGPNKFGEPGAA